MKRDDLQLRGQGTPRGVDIGPIPLFPTTTMDVPEHLLTSGTVARSIRKAQNGCHYALSASGARAGFHAARLPIVLPKEVQ